jgi:hypothetical protein
MGPRAPYWNRPPDFLGEPTMHRKLVKRSALAWVSIIILVTGASFQFARAQCAPGSKIFIDPRLVPHRGRMSQQQLHEAMRNPYVSEKMRQWALQQYYSQDQPIQIPFRNGTVFVSPSDPCVQQYVGP